MSNPTPVEVEEIARRLTKAQREAVIKNVQSWHGQFGGVTSWQQVGRVLKDSGLIAFAPDPRSSETYFTPLGEAVRTHLTGGHNDQ